MERTIEQRNLHGLNLISSEDTIGHCSLEALLNARNIFLRHIATLYRIDKLQSCLALISRTDFDNDICEFATTTGLLLEQFTMLNSSCDSLFIINLRSTLVDIDTELTTETVYDDIQVKLTHTANHCLACLVV